MLISISDKREIVEKSNVHFENEDHYLEMAFIWLVILVEVGESKLLLSFCLQPFEGGLLCNSYMVRRRLCDL